MSRDIVEDSEKEIEIQDSVSIWAVSTAVLVSYIPV